MPLYLFYTMVQKSQKWPKTQIKGGPALKHQFRRQYFFNLRMRHHIWYLQLNWKTFSPFGFSRTVLRLRRVPRIEPSSFRSISALEINKKKNTK